MVTAKLRLKRKFDETTQDLNISQEENSNKVRNTRSRSSSSKNDSKEQKKSMSKISSSNKEGNSVRFSPNNEKSKRLTRSTQITESESSKSVFQKIEKPSSSSQVKNAIRKPLQKKKKKMVVLTDAKQHFRSSFKPLLSFLNNHNSEILIEFDEEMSKTPFGPLYQVLRKNIVKDKHLKKTNAAIIKIIQQFDRNEKIFKFGSKSVQLTIEDVALVFGIPGAGKFVNFVDRNFQERTDFVKRMWPDFGKDKHVSKIDVESALERVLKAKKETDAKDYVRLIVTYIVMTIFSPSSSARISWSFFPYVEAIENLEKIDWASAIHKTLLSQLCKWSPSRPWTVTGYSLLLLYFVSEHTTLIQQLEENKDSFPRFAKWSTTELIKVLENKELDTLHDDEVNALILNFKPEEANLLINKYENQFLDDVFEDVRKTEINKLRLKVASLQKENDDLRQQVQNLKQILKQNDRRENDEVENGEGAVDQAGNNQDEFDEAENNEGGYNIPENSEGGNDENEKNGVGNHNGETDEGKSEEASKIEEGYKLLEYYCDESVSEFWKDIEKSAKKIASESSRMEQQQQETNEDEQQRIQDEEQRKKELIVDKNLKRKISTPTRVNLRERRKTNLQIEKKDLPEKKEQKKKRNAKVDTSLKALPAIELEKNNDIPELVKLKNVRRSETWKNLDDTQKPIVEHFFNKNYRNTEVWKSTNSDVIIYGATLESLMFNEPLNNLVIDWYSYQLHSKQDSDSTKSYFFPAQTFTILSNGNKDLIEKFVVNIIKDIDTEFDYWFFPINTNSPNSSEGHHWTLLQVDTQSWEWFHYNTLKPRQVKGRRADNDLCLKNAKELRQMLINIMKRCWSTKRFLKVNLNTKVKSMDCTQQNQHPNCALYVCQFMDILSKNRTATEYDEYVLAMQMEKLRAELVYAMLTDDETCLTT